MKNKSLYATFSSTTHMSSTTHENLKPTLLRRIANWINTFLENAE